MERSLRLGVIGGGGWLGGAIVQSLLDAGLVSPQSLSLSYRSGPPARFPGAFWTTDSQVLADRSDVIIVSVRPEDWPALVMDARGKLVISVMAGIRLEEISRRHNTARVVRAMPNAAAEVGMSYTPWVASPGIGEEDRATVRLLFEACGVEDEAPSESDIDYLTGLTGSGSAFPALLAAAMMKDAVAHGLSPETAHRAVNALIIGAGRLTDRSREMPDKTVETFLAYRGTTAAAIETMRAAGFDRAVAEGLAAAFRKSLSMGS